MYQLHLLSTLVSVAALGWLLVTGARVRTRWFRGLALVLAVIVVHQILAILTLPGLGAASGTGVAFPLVSSLILSGGAVAAVAVVASLGFSELDCEEVQGFLFSQAVTAAKAKELLMQSL